MSKLKSPLTSLLITIIVIALLALFGPEEKSLGSNVRIVYLHGAWVLSAELAFLAAGLAGLIALVSKKDLFHNWSAALGRTGFAIHGTKEPDQIGKRGSLGCIRMHNADVEQVYSLLTQELSQIRVMD